MAFSEGLRNEYTEYLCELIRFPSLTGEEGDCAQFVLKSLEDIGVEAYIDTAGNVVGELRGGDGPTVLLASHLDVVPAGSLDAWAPYTPFGGEVDGDMVIGRGASDIKGGLAAQYFALRHFKRLLDAGGSFGGTIIFGSVVHEEAAEMLGMQVLIEETLAGRQVDLCLLCEPSSGKIALGHRGKVELVVSTHGKTAHSSQPQQGINALQKMLPVMNHIFYEMGPLLKSDPVLGDSSVTITDCVVSPGAQSIVPDLCEISIDRRYMPGEDIPELVAQLEGLFAKMAEGDPEFKADARPRAYDERTYTGLERRVDKYHPAWVTDQSNPLVKAALEALPAVGQEADIMYWKFGTDGSMTAGLHNIPTIGYSHAEEKWAHQPKEQVSITEMLKSVDGNIAMLAAVLGAK